MEKAIEYEKVRLHEVAEMYEIQSTLYDHVSLCSSYAISCMRLRFHIAIYVARGIISDLIYVQYTT